MDIGLHTGASHMALLEHWQAMISDNLSNASTPGFQKSVFEIASPVIESTDEVATPDPLAFKPLPVGTTQRVFSGGEIRITGSPYDLAIHGEGFFALTGKNGEQVFTKDGEFHLNSEGTLVNKMGYAVQADGAALSVQLEEGPITVYKDGTVNQNGQDIGRLSIFEFARPEELERGSGSYFLNPGNRAGQTAVEYPEVVQGQLMGSSVSPLSEMVSMIQVSRAYEITQKLIQEIDERGGKVVQTFSV